MARARAAGLTSDEHFPVDGTLIEAWASMKSFRPKDEPPTPGPGRNREVDFRGESRTNDTHESTTDPDCRLYKKSPGAGARLCHLGNLVMEHRGGFIVNTLSVPPAGNAEREAAVAMASTLPGGAIPGLRRYLRYTFLRLPICTTRTRKAPS